MPTGLPIAQLLYAGATTKIIGHTEVWFGNGQHTVDPTRMPNYKSNDPVAITAQTKALQAAGVDILMYNWYGPGRFEDECTQNYFAVSPLGHIINIDAGAFPNGPSDIQTCMSYIRSTYFPHSGYEKWNGKYVVTYFAKPGNDPAWFRQVEAENPDVAFVYNGTQWGANQMAWVQQSLQQDAQAFCAAYASKSSSGLYIPCVAAGFNDTNSKTGLSCWSTTSDPQPARVWPSSGPNWTTLMAYFSVINQYYSVKNQLPYLQLVTINDQDEGTGLYQPIPQLNIPTFLIPPTQESSTHLEFWLDGTKLGNQSLTSSSKEFTVNQVDSNGNVMATAELTLGQ